MARNKALTTLRNEAIRKRFAELRKKNPKWMFMAILQQLSEEYFLEEVTIAKILSDTNEPVPAASTVSRICRAMASAAAGIIA
mgnify:CR=1 FL=1